MPPQIPVSFCFFAVARAALESGIAARAASMCSGAAYPSGASSRYVRYRMASLPYWSSQESGIRCWDGSSRGALGDPGRWVGIKRAQR